MKKKSKIKKSLDPCENKPRKRETRLKWSPKTGFKKSYFEKEEIGDQQHIRVSYLIPFCFSCVTKSVEVGKEQVKRKLNGSQQ